MYMWNQYCSRPGPFRTAPGHMGSWRCTLLAFSYDAPYRSNPKVTKDTRRKATIYILFVMNTTWTEYILAFSAQRPRKTGFKWGNNIHRTFLHQLIASPLENPYVPVPFKRPLNIGTLHTTCLVRSLPIRIELQALILNRLPSRVAQNNRNRVEIGG